MKVAPLDHSQSNLKPPTTGQFHVGSALTTPTNGVRQIFTRGYLNEGHSKKVRRTFFGYHLVRGRSAVVGCIGIHDLEPGAMYWTVYT